MERIDPKLAHDVLLQVFYNLRDRQYDLSPSDLKWSSFAIQKGIGINSKEDFILAVQTLWAKSVEECQEIEDIIQIAWNQVQSDDNSATKEAGTSNDEQETKQDNRTSHQKAQHKDREKNEQKTHTLSDHLVGSNVKEENLIFSSVPVDKSLYRDVAISHTYNLKGISAINKRYMSQAWRFYTKMERHGPTVELDLDATIDQIGRNGLLAQPVMRARVSNQAGILILVDTGGSMEPYRVALKGLFESLNHGGFKKTTMRYFHDVPRKKLYLNQQLQEWVEADEVYTDFSMSSVLIISDGGAARGNYNESRVKLTVKFIQQLRNTFKNIAWLNPTPPERWNDSTAGAIIESTGIRMSTYNKSGLNEMVDVLRGRKIQ